MRWTTRCGAVALAGVLSGCSGHSYPRDDHTITKTPTQGEAVGRPTLALPIPIPGQTACLVPFAIESVKGVFQDPDPYTRGYVSYSASPSSVAERSWTAPRGGSVRWHNAIVRDLSSNEEWPILERRGVISQWYPLGPWPAQGEQFRAEALVFVATLQDTNTDGLLNDLDATVAIAAAGDGRRPRTVTPADAQVWDMIYDPQTHTAYFLVVRDTSGDGKFTPDDEPRPYSLDLRTAAEAAPVVSAAAAERARALLR